MRQVYPTFIISDKCHLCLIKRKLRQKTMRRDRKNRKLKYFCVIVAFIDCPRPNKRWPRPQRRRPATAAMAGVLSASVSVGKTATIRSIGARDPTVEALDSVETVVRGRSRTPTRLCRLSRREKIQTETSAIALLSSNWLSDSRPQSIAPPFRR